MSETGNKEQAAASSARWVHTLNGPWRTETYGIVAYLRVHPAYRRIVAVVGVVACILAVAGWTGLIPGLSFKYVAFIIIGPWLLHVATISGPEFEVTFPQRQAAQEREEAEKKFGESKTAENALKLDLTRLNEY